MITSSVAGNFWQGGLLTGSSGALYQSQIIPRIINFYGIVKLCAEGRDEQKSNLNEGKLKEMRPIGSENRFTWSGKSQSSCDYMWRNNSSYLPAMKQTHSLINTNSVRIQGISLKKHYEWRTSAVFCGNAKTKKKWENVQIVRGMNWAQPYTNAGVKRKVEAVLSNVSRPHIHVFPVKKNQTKDQIVRWSSHEATKLRFFFVPSGKVGNIISRTKENTSVFGLIKRITDDDDAVNFGSAEGRH